MQLKWHKEAIQWDRLKKGGDFLCRICERRIFARLERTHTVSCQELATVSEELSAIDKKFVSLSETVSKQIVAKNAHEHRKFIKQPTAFRKIQRDESRASSFDSPKETTAESGPKKTFGGSFRGLPSQFSNKRKQQLPFLRQISKGTVR